MRWIDKVIVPLTACFLMGATHIGPKYDTRPRYALDAFAKELARQYKLEFLNSGLGSLADAKQGIWGLSLVSRQQMTLEEGRAFANEIADKLIAQVFKDPLFAKYCQKSAPYHGPELKKEHVAFRLAFWDKNTDRPLFPYLAQIRLADGKLYYHYANPETQALQEAIEEDLISFVND